MSFRFQARKHETKQSVKRDKRNGEHGVKTESANAFTRKNLLTRNIRNIFNHGEWCIQLLQVVVLGARRTHYFHSY